jgi:hypothetical protein
MRMLLEAEDEEFVTLQRLKQKPIRVFTVQ